MIRDMMSLQDRMNRLFEEAFPSTRGRTENQEGPERPQVGGGIDVAAAEEHAGQAGEVLRPVMRAEQPGVGSDRPERHKRRFTSASAPCRTAER